MNSSNLPAGITPEQVAEMQRISARCWIIAGLIIGLPLEALDRLTEHADRFGPNLYPEIWRTNAEKIFQDRELIRTLVKAQRELLTVSPHLRETLAGVEEAASEKRAVLAAAIRDICSRRELAALSPLAILSGFVQWIAQRAPDMLERARKDTLKRC